MRKFPILLVLLSLMTTISWSQGTVGIKTNLLYGFGTFTPNLGLEIGLGKRTSLDLAGGYNWFNLQGSLENNKKAVHWIGQAEFRYFLCQRFNGHYFGVHALYSQYNISQHELFLLFGKGSKNYRYEGDAFGGGLSYGYQFLLGRSWNLDLSIGIGYARLKYNQYNCPKCGDKVEGKQTKNYFGPTKAAISLIYIIP